MTEKEIQKLLFTQFVKVRKLYKVAIPNFYGAFGWECDFLGLTSYGYMHEYEIKRSRSNYLADFKDKVRKHNALRICHSERKVWNVPKRFYFVIHGFWLNASELPDYAGLLVVTENGLLKTVRRAPDLPSKKISQKQSGNLAVSLCHRFWNNV